MPQLNRDILREVLFEDVKTNGFTNIDKFMMAGREPFQLGLNYCREADDVIIFEQRIVAKFPQIEYKPPRWHNSGLDRDDEDRDKPILGTEISTNMKLFKPISVALASTLTSLDLRSFSRDLIPMLKAVDNGMQKVRIQDTRKKELKDILQALTGVPNVEDGVTIRLWPQKYDFGDGMKFFAIPCDKLTIKWVDLNTIYNEIDLDNRHLRNIRHLTIKGDFRKGWKYLKPRAPVHPYLKDVKQFVSFLATNFPNLETFNADIDVEYSEKNYKWDWNDSRMANCFKALPFGVKGSITYKILKRGYITVDLNKFHNVEKDGSVYSKVFQVTSRFSLKLITTFYVKHRADYDDYFDVGYGYLHEPGDYVSD